jgi:hypothetical protein
MPDEQVEVAGNRGKQDEQVRMITLICNVAALRGDLKFIFKSYNGVK